MSRRKKTITKCRVLEKQFLKFLQQYIKNEFIIVIGLLENSSVNAKNYFLPAFI